MTTGQIVLTVVLAAVLMFFLLPVMIMSFILYSVILVRSGPEKWKRGCSAPQDKECLEMYNIGMDWAAKYAENKKEVSITNEKLRLAGEYFDFGSDKAVIIIPGRTETLEYSYYFSEPYRAAGYSVLVIDNRATGLSDGKYTALGYSECRDTVAWCRYLHDTLNIKQIVLHGVCIGSSTALFTAVRQDCPEYVKAIVSDGMYTSFYETFRTHMIQQKKPNFPLTYGVMFWAFVCSHARPVTRGPLNVIDGLEKPVLFMHSKADVFSLPEKSKQIYDKCHSDKTVVWFDKGGHSRIRINNTEAYDRTVEDFLEKLG